MRIALYGFMGAGKSTLGKALAQGLNYDFFDLDNEIQKRAKKSINAIFDEEGEIAFRRLEHQVLKDWIKQVPDKVILSLGGGAVLQPSNRKLLELKNFVKIYLDVSVPELVRRLQREKDERPLLKNLEDKDFDGFIEALHNSRKEIYEQHADIKLRINQEDFETVLERLYLLLNVN